MVLGLAFVASNCPPASVTVPTVTIDALLRYSEPPVPKVGCVFIAPLPKLMLCPTMATLPPAVVPPVVMFGFPVLLIVVLLTRITLPPAPVALVVEMLPLIERDPL